MAAPRRDSVQVLRVQLRSPVLIPTLVVVLALRHHLALQDVIQVLRAIRGLIAAILLPMATIISVLTIQDPIQIVRHWNDRLINQHLEVIPQIYLPITMTKMQITRLHLLITPL